MARGSDERRKQRNNNGTVIHQTMENCQVFNGDISGCVFAMPGAIVNQSPVQKADAGKTKAGDDEGELRVVNQLKPMFFGNEEDARLFLGSIQGMKATQITSLVNQWVAEQRISVLSRKRDLWRVLHDCGIYTKSESNWNNLVK